MNKDKPIIRFRTENDIRTDLYPILNIIEQAECKNIDPKILQEYKDQRNSLLAEFRKLKELESNKPYRFKQNPEEQFIHDMFIFENSGMDLSLLVFEQNSGGMTPSKYLSIDETKIVLSTIQWLGSHVGNSFLNKIGYTKNK